VSRSQPWLRQLPGYKQGMRPLNAKGWAALVALWLWLPAAAAACIGLTLATGSVGVGAGAMAACVATGAAAAIWLVRTRVELIPHAARGGLVWSVPPERSASSDPLVR
jgi:hypothetical protein